GEHMPLGKLRRHVVNSARDIPPMATATVVKDDAQVGRAQSRHNSGGAKRSTPDVCSHLAKLDAVGERSSERRGVEQALEPNAGHAEQLAQIRGDALGLVQRYE